MPPTKQPDPLPLLQMTEIAELLGLTRQRVNELALRRDFPEPVGKLSTGRVWARKDILAWAKEAGRSTAPKGRRPRK